MHPARDKNQRLSAISRMTPVPNAAFVMPFQSGEIIGGKYKVLKMIGMGGVAFVVSARHVALDEVVALKFLRPEFATHQEAVRRFTIEGRANFKIQSEHVVRVLDVDALPDGTPFIVMELLDGTDLGRVLETRGALPVELAVSYVLQACEGLATAHAAYVVHRDIKPENLFLTKTEQGAPRIKLLDFGISKVALTEVEHSPQAHTQSTSILGSPPYMSPEQVRASSETDSRTDIWSLGCVLYELLTYRAPFERPSVAETCAAILTDAPAPLQTLCPQAPAELEAIVMRCLSKDPNERFQDVGQLAHALLPFAHEAPGLSAGLSAMRSGELAGSAEMMPEDDRELNTLRALRSSGRATNIQRALIASAIAVVLGGTYATMQRSSTPNAAKPISSATTTLSPAQHIATPAPVAAPAVEAPSIEATTTAPSAASTPTAAPVKPRVKVKATRPPKPKSTEPDVGF